MILDVLTKVYRAANERKLLDTKLGKAIFRRAYFSYKRIFEDSLHLLIRQHPGLFSGGHIIDVGANIGYTAVQFSKVIGLNYKVFAIEPDPSNIEKLKETIAHFHLKDKVVPIQAAVGETAGEVVLWQNKSSHADHRVLTEAMRKSLSSESEIETVKVPLISLDGFANSKGIVDKISFVKIDVQGYELPVVKGMANLIKRNPRLSVCLEYSPEISNTLGFDAEDTFYSLSGFLTYILAPRGLTKIEADEIQTHLVNGYADVLFTHEEIES